MNSQKPISPLCDVVSIKTSDKTSHNCYIIVVVSMWDIYVLFTSINQVSCLPLKCHVGGRSTYKLIKLYNLLNTIALKSPINVIQRPIYKAPMYLSLYQVLHKLVKHATM